MITGLLEGNSPSDLAQAEQWLGANLGAVGASSGGANWSDFVTSVGYEQGLWSSSGKTVLWSVPLFANGGNLQSAGQGAYDSYYVQAAQELAAGQSTGPIYVRTGWEFNSSWEPWSALTDPTDYIAAYQQFVDSFRTVSSRFVFTWSPNIGDQGMNPAAAYPGNAYVDIIGMDFYWETQYDSSDPTTAWNTMLNQTYGLNWLAQFAAQEGKPIAIPEWGVESDNAAAYINAAVSWFNAHNVV
ncbi:MAG: glycosyl hydrolase, partial [Caulobacteraceae bacterium]